MTKEYLGDSVYAEIENDMIKLTTEDGFEASNTIFLEPWVISALMRFWQAHLNENKLNI